MAYLALDTASPTVSLAVGGSEGIAAERTLPLRRSSERLLGAVEEALAEAGTRLDRLAGIAALQGPGSFTGLRIGLATVLGWHQALDVPATALPTLPVIAATAGPGEALAAVDAIRDDWHAQRFRVDTGGFVEARGEARLWSLEELRREAPAHLVGFGVAALGKELPASRLSEPPPLAATAVALLAAGGAPWDPGRLVRPIYSRPPAVSSPVG